MEAKQKTLFEKFQTFAQNIISVSKEEIDRREADPFPKNEQHYLEIGLL
jgi:hypothetical protein